MTSGYIRHFSQLVRVENVCCMKSQLRYAVPERGRQQNQKPVLNVRVTLQEDGSHHFWDHLDIFSLSIAPPHLLQESLS